MSLRSHPFPIVAHFDRVMAISFAFPADALASLLPPGLRIDRYENFGFVTVAVVWTNDLRVAGAPKFLGQNFFLAGYRIFTTLRDESGRTLRGLRILRSETDRRRMVWLGNFLTGYRYRHIGVRRQQQGAVIKLETLSDAGLKTLGLTLEIDHGEAPLPAGSPFPDWQTARRFAGPMPFTFSPRGDGSFVVVEGSRTNWRPRPIRVLEWQVSFFDEAPLSETTPILANAFSVEDIDYRWKKGRIVRPAPLP